ncbi:transglycosylase domain-containing protein [Streptomyces sp. HNM0574]|uniref:transglycosylase domain-containing protein n=1 Tax=Streptomyces sp. HNM0574 TaxID=2714954 RepID=UPI00146D61C6|nr:transglycosylase domain-containing protein [Streptomyces sp. HNM0574]NLU69532.1 penicillin-binding protein [Streptomyces sp. HNM0574]
MSEHRRKPPQGRGRRSAPPSATGRGGPAGRESEPPRDAAPSGSPYGGRAEARRAARGGGGRRRAASGAGAGAGAAMGAEGRAAGGGRRAARAAGAGAGAAGAARAAGSRRGRPVDPSEKRFINYPRVDKDGAKRWMPSWRLVTGTCLGFLGLMIVLAGIGLWWVDVPKVQAAAKAQKNVFYWKDGTQMVVAGGGDQNRQIVPLAQIPKEMQEAVVSAENETFWTDKGVDPMGIIRALGRMAMGGETQSGSTITQQYVKNSYLDQSQTIERKVKELLISTKVGATQGKEKILAGYLNTAYYGRGAYGIQAAAQAYYGKNSRELNASESAFLASTLNGPNLYDPAGGIGEAASPQKNKKRAEARWSWILDRMVETGELKKAQRAKITEFPMPQPPRPSMELKGQTGYLVTMAKNYITSETDITERQLERGGYRIHTTFDKKAIKAMEDSVEKVKKANIDPKTRDVDKYVQFGGASVVPGDGAIRAIYGGEDATTHYRNNADYTGVQVGSTFKPFVLAAAMRDGKRDPNLAKVQTEAERTKVSLQSVYNGDNRVKLRDYNGEIWHDRNGKEWHQRNDGEEDYGRVNLRTAMQYSINTPFIQLGMDVGTDKVKQAALDAGIPEEQLTKTTPTFSLGTSAPSAVRLANAYGTFANSGMASKPYSVTKVERDGEVKYEHKKETTSAFDAAVADNVTSSLETVVQEGTGTPAKALGRPAAGKTGTTDGNKSAWFAGYTPQLSTSIGMWRVNANAKNQQFLEMYGVGGQKSIHGASFPAEIWTKYMQQAMKGKKVVDFPEPTPIGEKVYGDGASPSPKPTPSDTPSEKPSESPSDDASESASPSPSPSESCKFPWDEGCQDQGQSGEPGTDEGADQGTDQGMDQGQDGGPTEEPGNPGGIFGGPTGGGAARPEEE